MPRPSINHGHNDIGSRQAPKGGTAGPGPSGGRIRSSCQMFFTNMTISHGHWSPARGLSSSMAFILGYFFILLFLSHHCGNLGGGGAYNYVDICSVSMQHIVRLIFMQCEYAAYSYVEIYAV